MARPIALVTGASMGIGRELALQFAQHGHDVILVARSEAKLQELAEELRRRDGVSCTVIAADLARPGSAQKLFDEVKARGLAVESLVNNAGYGLKGPFFTHSLDEQRDMIQLNVTTLMELAWLFGRDMAERGKGHILNVGSVASFQPGPEFAVYSGTKAFVLIFSESLDAELRPRGVNVTALCPGAVTTSFHDRANNDSKLLLATAMAAEPVAEAGYRALMARRPVTIPGIVNWLAIFFVRFSPRRLVTRVAYFLIGRSPASA